MSYSTIGLSAGAPAPYVDNGDGHDDMLFSPFHTNFADIDEDDANFFDFTRNQSSSNTPRNGKDGKSSELATGFNFVNSIVGAGIIGIPIAIKECGLFMGIFLLILVAFLVDQSVIMLIDCGVQAKKKNFEGEGLL